MLNAAYPELGEKVKKSFIYARLALGNKYVIKTKFDIAGQGIKFIETLKAESLVPQAQHFAGWKKYSLTSKAFEKLCSQYEVSMELLLD